MGVEVGCRDGKAKKGLASGQGVALKAFVVANFNVMIVGDKTEYGILPVAAILGALDAVVKVGAIFG